MDTWSRAKSSHGPKVKEDACGGCCLWSRSSGGAHGRWWAAALESLREEPRLHLVVVAPFGRHIEHRCDARIATRRHARMPVHEPQHAHKPRYQQRLVRHRPAAGAQVTTKEAAADRSKASKIAHPHSRYVASRVTRQSTKSDSTVSGRSRLWSSLERWEPIQQRRCHGSE